MKKITTLLALLVLAMTASSQSFEQRQTEINAGVLFNPFSTSVAGSRLSTKNLFPPLFVSADRGVSKHFSLGICGIVARHQITIQPASGVGEPETIYRTEWFAGVQPLYHLRLSRRFDLYTGGMVITDFRGVGINLTAGAKYRIDDMIGIYFEAHIATIGAGLSYRFLSKR